MTSVYRFALLGQNISYSKSPDIFEVILKRIGAQGSFELFDKSSGELGEFVRQLKTQGLTGVSVTIPHKEAIVSMLNRVDSQAISLAAVNSIKVDDQLLVGYNTDVDGFVLPLTNYADELREGKALILGSGGAARAVILSLYSTIGVRDYTIVGRNEGSLRKIAAWCREQLNDVGVRTAIRTDTELGISERFNIAVNCTPLGGWNLPDDHPLPIGVTWDIIALYYDLNYNDPNKAVDSARESGIVAIDGKPMLVGQALRSFEIWTGLKVEFEPVFSRVFGNPSR